MTKILRQRPILILGLATIVLVGCAGHKTRLKVGATDEGEVVEAEGLAPDNRQDLIATKRASLLDAERNAVEKVVGVYVSAKTMVEKAVAIENNILSRTDGYVKKYDILSETTEGGLYKTKIRALVGLKDLEAALKEFSLLNTPVIERPRVFIKLVEQVDKDYVEDLVATRSLENGLSERGFVVVSKEREKEAELVIEGKAAAFPFQEGGLGGFVSYRARLTMQVRRPGTNEIVLSLSKEASGLGGNNQLAGMKALETVGQVAAEDVADKVSQAWAKGKTLLVYVEGVQSFEDVERVRKHLSSQPSVADLVLRLYEGGTAQYEVQLGNAKAGELASSLQASQSMPVEILQSSPQSLRLKLK